MAALRNLSLVGGIECRTFVGVWRGKYKGYKGFISRIIFGFNLLTPELNPSAQSYLPRFFTGDFKL
jgi:hypothetical protein